MMQLPLLVLFTGLLLMAIITGCSEGVKNSSPAQSTTDSVFYPYEAIYTSAFEPGKQKQTETVLQIWKEWETGSLPRLDSLFADSLSLILPGEIIRGKKEEILKQYQKKREVYRDMQCYIDAWLPLRARDANEDIVLIWGRQDGTTTSGRRDYLVLHQVWRYNTDGKIFSLTEYQTHPH
jgi:hypothetical protein